MNTKKISFSILVLSTFGFGSCKEETSTSTFLEAAKKCVPSNVLGPNGAFVFYGPNDYRPGDLFTRSGQANKQWFYNPQFQYAKQVSEKTVADVVQPGKVPAECAIKEDSSFSLGAEASGNATITAAAVPLSATAGLSLKGGKVENIKVSKLYLDTVPFFDPYQQSLKTLPVAAPARVAVEGGGYYVTTAVLVTDGYSVDVKYGPDFNAKAEAKASVPSKEKAEIKGNVSITAKDEHTLTFTVTGKTALGLVLRPIGADFVVQSALPANASAPVHQYVSNAELRGWPAGQ